MDGSTSSGADSDTRTLDETTIESRPGVQALPLTPQYAVKASLDAPVARVERAAFHYRTLKYDLHGGVDHRRRPVNVECDDEGREYRFYVDEIESLDPVWPVILGEALDDLRSALDHLIYELHVRRFHGAPPADVAEDCAFPIRIKEKKDTKGVAVPTSSWRQIKRLKRRDRDRIERLQPYKGWGDRDPATKPIGQLRRVLWDIHQLSVMQRRYGLHPVPIVATPVPHPPFPHRFGFKGHPATGIPLVSYSCVDCWTFTTAPPQALMDPHPSVYSAVGIDGAGQGVDVLPMLGGCILGVAVIIDRFIDRFPPSTAPEVDLSWIMENRE
jgi:hypothetical protein